ncbi:putative nucleic acid-binding protein, contains PIN domain [Terriglobus roseus DSM 18391]|uniref:Putative nucleic acid-binding protein, contains PIN domain n=1 Tax=Terriglobus roseus (strain DSM 18391 / NRRL B-41598 / KBS 63) TaxID=926566 RepID=I3ZK78_TERRK|nr:PIN domain-containing protein [Terriglobus roseus]AFL89646.1 putative nucleic acid-binding protein, contains PIN domain [Terriglobus roseus DSM 18391]
MASFLALDTNVLLALSETSNPKHEVATLLFLHLATSEKICCFTAQNIREFWSVCTKPLLNNGFNLSTDDTASLVFEIERSLTLLADDQRAYDLWIRLATQHKVRGAQVHDTYLAATLAAHNVSTLATWNTRDFKRFEFLTCLTPEPILAGALA